MQNLKDSLDPTTAMNKSLALIAKAFKFNTIPTNKNQRSLLTSCNSQIVQPNLNMSQNIKMQMVDDNVGNQVRQNVVQNDRNEYGNGNVVTTLAKGNGNGINSNPIRCYNCQGDGHYATNYTVKSKKQDAAYLQQKLQISQEEEEKEYATLWNNWYKKCEECKYDKACNDMQTKIKRLQAQLGDLKGKSSDTKCASNTLDPLSHKQEDENMSLEFQVLCYAKENAHLKSRYKNLFDSIKVTQAQTISIIDSLQKQLYDTIHENAKLRAHLFDKVSKTKGTTNAVWYKLKTRIWFLSEKGQKYENDCQRFDLVNGGLPWRFEYSYACSDSLLLTPLCCDDIDDVTPRVFALAGCDRLVYTKSKEEHESHLKMNLELLKKEKFHVMPNKVEAKDDGWSDLRVVIARPSTIWERANVVVDAWSRKGGVKSKRVRDICRTIQAKTDGQSECTFRTFENMFRACVRDLVVVRILTFREAEIGESKMTGLELEQETTKVFMIKERLKEAKDHQEIKT
nr:hypothetical protein [Tanacetum cinerariifolium]